MAEALRPHSRSSAYTRDSLSGLQGERLRFEVPYNALPAPSNVTFSLFLSAILPHITAILSNTRWHSARLAVVRYSHTHSESLHHSHSVCAV